MFLKFLPFQGPKVFRFRDPDKKGKRYEAPSLPALLALIRGYREQNELPPIEYLETVVEHYLCGLPEHIGACGPKGPLKRGLLATLKGGVALISNMLYNKFVEQSVADERSAICAGCPENVFPDKGPFLAWSDDIAEQSVGSRKSIHHNELGNCGVCSCPLRPKVFYAGPFSFTEKQIKAFPDFCWQKKEALKEKAK